MEFYDVGASDLRELWDSYLESNFHSLGQDALAICRDDDWGFSCAPSSLRDSCGSGGRPSSCSGVVLRDRLMTDAALGGPKPIKSEHSYSLLACSPPPPARSPSPGACANDEDVNGTNECAGTRIQHRLHHSQVVCEAEVGGVFVNAIGCAGESSRLDVTDMEEECFPAISMNRASGRESSARSSPEPFTSVSMELTRPDDSPPPELCEEDVNEAACTFIKGEPLSAPCSPSATEPTSVFVDDHKTVAISPHSLHITRFPSHTSDSEDEDEEMLQEFKVEAIEVPCSEDPSEPPAQSEDDHHASHKELLPPTPPSSASSDSEGTVSASCSPERRDSHGSVHVHQSLRGFLQPRLYVTTNGAIGQHTASTRQPIHTPLISCQPKGSTGVLVLTEEEKRTLIAEGYPVPTKLPLTKQEEKSLKKVRRKIKNKISAQESRRKKKEYMDGLERRVTLLTNENTTYREKLSNLETTNRQLMKELQRLQAIIQLKSS